jgi:hypothetical protein
MADSSIAHLAVKASLLWNIVLFVLYTRCLISSSSTQPLQQPLYQSVIQGDQGAQGNELVVYTRATPRFLLPSKKKHVVMTVSRALSELGWTEHHPNNNGDYSSSKEVADWDLIWTYYDFWAFNAVMGVQLQSHHRVNHIRGHGKLVSKSDLWQTYAGLRSRFGEEHFDFLPEHFMLPEDEARFKAHVAAAPQITGHGQRWLFKSRKHKGVRIVPSLRDIENVQPIQRKDDKTKTDEVMVAKLIEPLLIDGFKWDVGIYVVITSITPLRIYTYDRNALVRVCKYPYPEALDSNSPKESYVIEDYVPPWELPSLKVLYC